MKLRFCNLKNTVVQLSKIGLRRQFVFSATERSNSSSIEERMKIFFAPTRRTNGDVGVVMLKEASMYGMLNIVELPSLMVEAVS
jgi:hypothetical protein